MISINNGSYYTDNYLSIMIIENVFGSLVVSLEMVGFGMYRLFFSFQRERKIELRRGTLTPSLKGNQWVPLTPPFIFDIRIHCMYSFRNSLTIH